MLRPDDYIKPLGRLIVGSVIDCNKNALERSLKFYDPQLYIKWNPKKRGGWGIWEIRRRPDHMTKVYQGTFQGQALYTLEYKEVDMINHVLDVPVLKYDILGKIKSMDAWNVKNWGKDLDEKAAAYKAKTEAAAKEELRYNIKQHKREWRELASLVSQGYNPGALLKGRWG